MVNPINGSEEIGKVNNFSPVNDFKSVLKNNFNELENPNAFMSTDAVGGTLKGEVSKTNIASDKNLMQDLSALTNKNFNVDDIESLSQNNMSADKTAKAFSKIMNNYMTDTNDKQIASDDAIEKFASGGDIDMHTVMIASEKANTSMQLTLQLRNKFVQAYQEISKMQV